MQCHIYFIAATIIGWQDMSDISNSDQHLLLARAQVIAGNPVITFSLTIEENFEWQLCMQGGVIHLESNGLLDPVPHFLSSVSAVHSVISFVNSCSMCCGNTDEQFIPLAVSRKGKFLDALGMIYSYTFLLLIPVHSFPCIGQKCHTTHSHRQ